MSNDIVIKIKTLDKNDFAEIEKALEPLFNVVPTSEPIFDESTRKWHMYLRLFKKVES